MLKIAMLETLDQIEEPEFHARTGVTRDNYADILIVLDEILSATEEAVPSLKQTYDIRERCAS